LTLRKPLRASISLDGVAVEKSQNGAAGSCGAPAPSTYSGGIVTRGVAPIAVSDVSGKRCRNLSPHFRKMLVSAVRRGLKITEKIISSKLTDAEAYKMEWQMIWDYHKRHAGQLWNTIDERGRNPEDLPKEWSNPVYPLYRLPRPFDKLPTASNAPIEGEATSATISKGAGTSWK
jgi:hypothetical protein